MATLGVTKAKKTRNSSKIEIQLVFYKFIYLFINIYIVYKQTNERKEL